MAGISAAEMDAMLEAEGKERPKCECHGEPQVWNKDNRKRAGGEWKCVIKNRGHQARYYSENREKRREYESRYRAENRERKREYFVRWRDKATTINVLSDDLSRRICFPEVDQLWRKHQKAVRLLSTSVEGERLAAQAAVDRLWARLEEETSKINGGKKWLHSQTISAEMRSTQPATTSALQLAA